MIERQEQLITVLDFTNGVVTKSTQAAFRQSQEDDCRANGHVFVSRGLPVPGQKCICRDITYPPIANKDKTT
jgi:hypothetical protein